MLVDFVVRWWLGYGQQIQCTLRAQVSTQQEAKWYRILRTEQRVKAQIQSNGLVRTQVSIVTNRYYLESVRAAQQKTNASRTH